MKHENREGLLQPHVALQATSIAAPDHDETLYWKFSPHLSLQDLFRTTVDQYATKTAVVMGNFISKGTSLIGTISSSVKNMAEKIQGFYFSYSLGFYF